MTLVVLLCCPVPISVGDCHATDGPPKIGPPGPSAAKYVAVDGPPGPSMAAIDGPPGPSMAALDGPPGPSVAP